jgi:Spy/CpxP family protein refolding chaperone
MKPIKYAILLLAALMAFSSAVEAKKIVTTRRVNSGSSSAQRRREQQQREKRAREKREKEAQALKKRREQYAALVKKRKASANAAEKERVDEATAARLKRENEKAAAEKAAREEKALLGEYETMATEVRMSSVQRAKLVALVKKLRGGPKATESGDNQGEIDRLTKAYNEATGAKKGIIASALEAARKKSAGAAGGSRADYHKKIMGLLTPAQKLKWGGYKLAKDPALKFEGITLTEKQIMRIRTICDAAAKDLPDEAADVDPKVAAKARQSVLRNVRLQIIYEVLTPEQRAAVQSDAAKKRAAAATAAAAADK